MSNKKDNKVLIAQAFVYKWTELSTLKWYIGSRTGRGCHPNDGYICSSSRVKPLILANPSNWKREVLFTKDCYTKEEQREMFQLEADILTLFDAKKDPRSFNMTNGDGSFTSAGKSISSEHKRKIGIAARNRSPETLAKISAGSKGRPMSEKNKIALKIANTNRVTSTETRAKHSFNAKNMSAETRAKIGAAKRGTKVSDETRAKLSESGKGRVFSKETLDKIAAKNMKPCTVDGITIYKSKGDLIRALGCGLRGMRSPNFRFIVNGEVN